MEVCSACGGGVLFFDSKVFIARCYAGQISVLY